MKLNVLSSSSSSLGSLMIISRYAVDRSFGQIYFTLFSHFINSCVCCVHLLKCWAVKTFNKTPSSHDDAVSADAGAPFRIFRNRQEHKIYKPNHTHIRKELTKTVRITTMKKKRKKCAWKQRGRANTFQRIVYEECQNEEIFCFNSISLSLVRSDLSLLVALLPWMAAASKMSSVMLLTVCLQNTLQHTVAQRAEQRALQVSFIVFLIFSHSIMMCPMCLAQVTCANVLSSTHGIPCHSAYVRMCASTHSPFTRRSVVFHWISIYHTQSFNIRNRR